jgi:hypothetical protein
MNVLDRIAEYLVAQIRKGDVVEQRLKLIAAKLSGVRENK